MSRWLNDGPAALSVMRARLRTLLTPAAVFVSGATVLDAVTAFEAWAAKHAGSVCEIGLSAAWVHVCVVPADVVVASEGDDETLIGYARLQFEHYFGLGGSAWTLAASRDARAALVCAVSTELLDALRAAAAKHHVRVQRVAPWWVRGAQTALREALQGESTSRTPRAVAAVEPGRTTLIVAQDGHVTRVVSEASGAPHDWRLRLQTCVAATSLWSFKLGADEQAASALRGRVTPELVFQQIEGAA